MHFVFRVKVMHLATATNFWISNDQFCFTGPYATFSFNSIFWLFGSTSSYTTASCCCSLVFGAGLELRPFLFHLLIQTVIKAPHRVPVMNATSRQTTAVMAAAADVDRLLSGLGIRRWIGQSFSNISASKLDLCYDSINVSMPNAHTEPTMQV